MSTRGRSGGLLLATLTSLALSACGTTVPLPQRAAPGVAPSGAGPQIDGLGAPLPPGAPPGAVPGSAVGPAGPAPAGGTTGGGFAGTSGGSTTSGGATAGGGSTTGGGVGSTGSTGGADGGVGPGITADRVFIGVMYYPDAAASNAAIGAGGVNAGDQRDYYNAAIDDLNKRGGVLGRQLTPLYYEFRTASSEPTDTQLQAACDYWTKDHKVFAIMFRGRVLQECAQKAGTLITSGDGESGPTFARTPNLVDPGAVRLERLGSATVSGLGHQSYFATTTEWPTGKIGVVTWEDPNYKYGISEGYAPGLKKLGKSADIRYVAVAQTVNAINDASSAVSSAVLAFKDAKIDHVLIQDGPAGVFGLGGLTLLFLNNAESQRYFPRYGFNANNVPGFSVYPKDQQHGMIAVDYSDYMPTQDEGITPNAARERCFGIMQQHGVGVGSQSASLTAGAACQDTWLIETLLKQASEPTLAGVLQVVDRLGTSFASPVTYGTRLGPGRRDGGELARNSVYDDSCSCMKYASKPYAP